MTRRALVLDGASGPALAVIRALGRAGWETITETGTRSARSRYTTATASIPDPTESPEGFVEGVGNVARRTQLDVVVPCTDASVTLLRANEHLLKGAKILGGDAASTRVFLDKATALAAAGEAGFGVPQWVVPETYAEAVEAMHAIGLPLVVKPRLSYVAREGRLEHRRSHFVQTPEQLEEAVRGSADRDSLPVVQEYIPGRALAVTAVLREGRVLAAAARETFSFLPVGGGTSVWKRTIPLDAPGVAAAIRLLQVTNYEGLAEVEYQVGDDGVPRLMEVGVRAHGWIGLAVAAGVNVPVIAAAALVGDELPPMVPYRTGLEMRWPAGELLRLGTAASRRPALPPGVTRAKIVKRAWPPWKPGMRYDGLDLRDWMPWVPGVWRLGIGSPRLLEGVEPPTNSPVIRGSRP